MICAVGHIPTLTLKDRIFSEPGQNAAFRDGAAFPAGQSTVARGVDPARRATTIAEAILEHALSSTDTASEARASRAAYRNRTTSDKQALIAFLETSCSSRSRRRKRGRAAAAALSLFTGPRQAVKIAPKGFRIRLPQ